MSSDFEVINNSQEELIVSEGLAVGNTVTLSQARAELSEKFELGDDNKLERKLNAVVTPMDFAKAMVYASKVSHNASWMVADAMAALRAMGHDNAVDQLASMLGLSYSAVSNYDRVSRRVPPDLRDSTTSITSFQEVACRRYDQDDQKNEEIIAELCKKVRDEKLNSNEARSLAEMTLGKEPRPKQGRFRYIILQPGVVPLGCMEEPAWSEGCTVLDVRKAKYLHDDGKRVDWVPFEISGSP